MNGRILACLLAGTISALAAPGTAQQGMGPQPFAQSAPQHDEHRFRDAEKQLGRLTKKLKLSARQRDEIKPILEDRQARMQALRRDDSLPPENRGEKALSILREGDTKIEAFLSDDQRQIFQKQISRKEQREMQQRLRHEDREDSFTEDPPPPDDAGGPPDGGPPPDGGGPPDSGPPGW